MIFKTTLTKSTKLSFAKESVVFDDNHEFTLSPQDSGNNNYIFQVHDFKGDFEIIKIYCKNGVEIIYDKENKTFVTTNTYSAYEYEFSIVTDIEYREVGYVYVPYQLKFPSNRMKLLKRYEFYTEYFTLPEYENMMFKYYIKKIRENFVEVHILNPLKAEIYENTKGKSGKTEDFIHEVADSRDLTLNLAFVFDPSVKNELNVNTNNKIKTSMQVNDFYEIMSNNAYADVVIFSSSTKEILTYRCVLAKYSPFFAKQFEETKDLPVKLNFKDFDTETIQAALDFCYGKTDAIIGKEAKIFEFANKYSFSNIMKACCSYFENDVNPSNVCEIVQIAYSNNFESLKEKCHKILFGQKEKIDSAELKNLPKEILINAFCL